MESSYIYLGLAIFSGFMVIYIYNRIVALKNSAERGWANVITQERQKSKILPKLYELVSQYSDYEKGVQELVTAYRSSAKNLNPKDINVDALKQVESDSRALIGGMSLVAEAYPDLKASETYLNAMNEVTHQEENVGASLRVFNSNVEDFNSFIGMFPMNIVNSIFNKQKRVDVFDDSESSKAFEYNPGFK